MVHTRWNCAAPYEEGVRWLWPSSSCQMNSSICDTIQCHLLELVTHGRLSNPWTVPTLRSIRWKTISSGNQVTLDTFIADTISLIFWSVDRQSVFCGNIHFQRPQWRWRWCWAVRRIMGNDMRRRNFWARAALERWFSENRKPDLFTYQPPRCIESSVERAGDHLQQSSWSQQGRSRETTLWQRSTLSKASPAPTS